MIVATAGHVDHGKTSLIKALTGTDTDRLPEEKKRGLTIEIGFAYKHLEDAAVIGFVDVPGHERFISNMLAGIASLDFALLIVAADDGLMPQTLEHLSALDLMGVTRGAVALTKCDMVPGERIEEVKGQVGELLGGTGLEGSLVFPVSSQTGEGVAALLAHLEQEARATEARASRGNFRLAVDRSFVVGGAGLVVTGTVHDGEIAVGDAVTVSPGGISARVRSIHAENRPAEKTGAGHRCALNLAGPDISADSAHRGDWIVASLAHAPTRCFDARLRVLASEDKPLRHWTPVHVHMGAVHLTGRVAVLEPDKAIHPGTEGDIQVVLGDETSVAWGDAFILRDDAATRIIGGGHVLDAFARGRDRAKPWRADDRKAHAVEEPGEALSVLAEQHREGFPVTPFLRGRNLASLEVEELRKEIADHLVLTGSGDGLHAVTGERWRGLGEEILERLSAFHEGHPDLLGCEPGALRHLIATRVLPPVLVGLVAELRGQGKVVHTGQVLHLPGHAVRLSEDDEAFAAMLAPLLTEDPLCPPVVHDLAKTLESDPANLVRRLDKLAAMGRLIGVEKQRYFLPGQIALLANHAEALGEASGPDGFTAAEFKNQVNVGRRPAVQILEFFDQAGLTRRKGNRRQIIRAAPEIFGDVFGAVTQD